MKRAVLENALSHRMVKKHRRPRFFQLGVGLRRSLLQTPELVAQTCACCLLEEARTPETRFTEWQHSVAAMQKPRSKTPPPAKHNAANTPPRRVACRNDDAAPAVRTPTPPRPQDTQDN